MAREFVSGSSQSASRSFSTFQAEPFTLSIWFHTSGNPGLWSFVNNAADKFTLGLSGGGALVAESVAGGVSEVATTANTKNSGAWNHALAAFASTSSRTAILNGGTAATNAVANAGMAAPTTWSMPPLADVLMGECACWNVDLTAGERAALAKGFSPLLIRPASLVAYWPFLSRLSPEPDVWRNSLAMTLANAPAVASTHPPMLAAVGMT